MLRFVFFVCFTIYRETVTIIPNATPKSEIDKHTANALLKSSHRNLDFTGSARLNLFKESIKKRLSV